MRGFTAKLGRHEVFSVCELGTCPDHGFTLYLTLPCGYVLFFEVGASLEVHRWRTLLNGDLVPYDEEVAPDDWRNQPLRPDGRPW